MKRLLFLLLLLFPTNSFANDKAWGLLKEGNKKHLWIDNLYTNIFILCEKGFNFTGPSIFTSITF